MHCCDSSSCAFNSTFCFLVLKLMDGTEQYCVDTKVTQQAITQSACGPNCMELLLQLLACQQMQMLLGGAEQLDRMMKSLALA